MSVRPVVFNADGSIDVVYDEKGHDGTIPAAEVQWTTNMDGSHNHNFIILNCPDGCGASSTHPVGGGAAPPDVQQMFVDKVQSEGCACGQVTPTDTDGLGESHVRLNCNRMDGPGRWQIGGTVSVVDTQGVPDPQAPKQFQVVYNTTSSLIIGMEPSGGVGPDNSVAVIHDLAEYDVLMATDPAYLSADKEHILASPPA